MEKETLQKETERLGLDKPIIVQYGKWAKSFIKGDLGVTSNGEQVSTKLKERIPNTLLLTLIVIFLSLKIFLNASRREQFSVKYVFLTSFAAIIAWSYDMFPPCKKCFRRIKKTGKKIKKMIPWRGVGRTYERSTADILDFFHLVSYMVHRCRGIPDSCILGAASQNYGESCG